MNRSVSILVGLVVAATLIGIGAPAHAEADDPLRPYDRSATAGRMLVVSVPGLTWADLAEHDLPALEAFFGGAALANLATRSAAPHAGPGDGYLTISGGSRAATDPEIDGQILGLDEESEGSTAGEIARRRRGQAPDGPFVSLSWPTLERVNDAEAFDTEIGTLTEALDAADVSVAAIGNADGVDAVEESYERQVGLALADASGVVPGGELGKELLEPDLDAPYGVRLDPQRVGEAFDDAWAKSTPGGGSAGGVVLVEASDLARTLRYRPLVERERFDELWADALEATDELVAQLMASVDLTTDRVMVVAPYNLRRDRDLTVIGLDGPGIEPGYLRSASTQRSGFVALVDVGPTILDAFDLSTPVAMEGRPAVDRPSGDAAAERVDRLIERNDAARFREQLLGPSTTVLVLGFAVVLALAIGAHANRWGSRARRAVGIGGLIVLAVLPMTYLARLFALEARGTGFFWAFVAVAASALAALATLIGARRGSVCGPLVVVLAVMGLVIVGDAVSGSQLSLSAAFGYGATSNSRLYGISNYAFGQLAAAACLVAAWAAAVRPGRDGRVLGIAVMVATLVVLGVPIWGSDVGGVLAFTPAVAVFAVLVTGRRIRPRTVVIAGVATVAAITVFGFVDLARAPASRGHLGRLFERIGAQGAGPFVSIAQRKLAASLEVSGSSMWVLAIPLGIAFWVFLARFPDRPYQTILERFPTLSIGLASALVAGVLGSALNDSGAIVGGVMALVVGTAMAVLMMGGAPPPPLAISDDHPEPDARRTVASGLGCDPVVVATEPRGDCP